MKIGFVFTLCLLGPLLGISQGYNNTVHFYLTVVVTKHIEPPITKDEKRLISLCAQLPDETEEYDAMWAWWKLLKNPGDFWDWGWTDNDDEDMAKVLAESKVTRELVTVQQLLHGLTGGDAEEMRITADNILETLMSKVQWAQSSADKAERLCAVGFAVHLLGDSLAHRRLDTGGLDSPEAKMYPTGAGHAYDGKKPDNLLSSVTSLDGIKRYGGGIPSLLPDVRTLKAGPFQKLYTKLEAANELYWWESPGTQARQAIIDETESWATESHTRPEEHDYETCQSYLNNLIPELVHNQCVPDCNKVFARFADTAKKEFESSHQSRLPALSLNDYEDPVAEGEVPVCPISNELGSGS